jgi:hypothetical protein
VWALLAATAAMASCGGSDDDAGSGSGTCDMTGVATSRECYEVSGSGFFMDQMRRDCAGETGLWTTAPCPTGELVGCCSYVFEVSVRHCFYSLASRSWSPATWCTSSTWEGVPGVWTPAP